MSIVADFLSEALQATGETFIQTGRGQFEKYDHSAVGKMEIELPPPVKESCFLLKDLQRDSELFAKYCTTNRNAYGTTVYIEIHTFLQVLHDLEILGIFQHQITRDVAERIFKRIGGRWAKEIPEDQFNMCLRSVQEYLIFQALSTMDVQLEPSTPRPPASAVSFRYVFMHTNPHPQRRYAERKSERGGERVAGRETWRERGAVCA